MSNRDKCFAILTFAPLSDQHKLDEFLNHLFTNWELNSRFNDSTQFVVYAQYGPFNTKEGFIKGEWRGIPFMVKPYGYWPS